MRFGQKRQEGRRRHPVLPGWSVSNWFFVVEVRWSICSGSVSPGMNISCWRDALACVASIAICRAYSRWPQGNVVTQRAMNEQPSLLLRSYLMLLVDVISVFDFSDRHGATQFFVDKTEEELRELHLPVYALYDFGNCSNSSSLSRSDLLETCSFTVRKGRCQPQYLMSVLCKCPPLTSTSRPSSTAQASVSSMMTATPIPEGKCAPLVWSISSLIVETVTREFVYSILTSCCYTDMRKLSCFLYVVLCMFVSVTCF